MIPRGDGQLTAGDGESFSKPMLGLPAVKVEESWRIANPLLAFVFLLEVNVGNGFVNRKKL